FVAANEMSSGLYNPFCSPQNMSKWNGNDESNNAVSVPLNQIKMIGYLQKGEHRQALVLLPNSVMKTVEPGFLLGSEKGEVVAVNRKQVVVRLADGRGVILTLTSS